ncbi:MAG: tetrathionate reductase family octaheme c-type cytochrome [Desulfobacterales bacterium]|nr:tetrathionate reductase family octaheme c-type cytochrome [Desulfobacterales bacterium]
MKSFKLLNLLAVGLAVLLTAGLATGAPEGEGEEQAPGRTMAQQATKEKKLWVTVNHGNVEALKRKFKSGPEVTRACLSCHSEAENQFKKTIHWTWQAGHDRNGAIIGKAGHSLNNFCISANMEQDKGCLSCHPGWGNKTESINCLVCHGQTDINWEESFTDYQAFSGSDDPEELEIAEEISADIQAAVVDISRPTRKNCGSCHFYGGGGDGVKHGDLDSSLTKPNKKLDVHMGTDGQDFECTRCHTTSMHNIAGRIYTEPAFKDRKSLIEDDLVPKITCESCHSAKPHKAGSKANDHTDKVACQSCHIPTFARVNPTKMSWDWAQSGKLKGGKPYKTKDEFGKHDYLTIKGQMKWARDVKPGYAWFNGSIESFTARDAIDPSGTVKLSQPAGGPQDPNSRIFPFKVHNGNQPYDKINKTLLVPLLSGPKGYWKTLDWKDALKRGNDAVDVPFSGEFDFVKTTYVFPTTHMVAPRDNVVGCTECHINADSRLEGIAGVYMPARDHFQILDAIGWIAVLGALFGVCLHGVGRVFANSNGRKEG